jgi:hypothetical protein
LTTASLGVLPTFTIWTASNPWCPSSSNATSVFLSNDRTALSNRIDTFSNSTLSDGTGTDVGTSWGVRALDPSWRGKLGAPSSASSRPSDYVDTETRKFLIIMTDGGITGQLRPKAGWTPSGPAHVGAGGSSFVYSRASALASFYELCDYAKGKGVSVYTIAFMVTDTGIKNEMRAHEEPLRAIAYNAGAEPSVVVNKVLEGSGNFGYNASNDTYGDMVEQGVLDPTKVTRCALQNAASVAGLILTTDAMVAELPKDDSPMPGGGGMGGMGGMDM